MGLCSTHRVGRAAASPTEETLGMSTANLNNYETNGKPLPKTNGAAIPNSNGTAIPDANGAVRSQTNGAALPQPAGLPRKLHRIGDVRLQQGTSLRSLSRKLNMSVQDIREQEGGTADLRISELLKWQEVLEVPLADLLIDSEGPLSDPVCERARMLRIMKTAKAIREGAQNRSIVRLASMLIDQLVEIMPELTDVGAWQTVGQRRSQDELGRIVERSIPDNFFNDAAG